MRGDFAACENYAHICFNVPKKNFLQVIGAIKQRGIGEWQKNETEGDSLYLLDDSGNKLEIHYSTLKERIKFGKKRYGTDAQWFV
ncbi:hypothetical protein AGMMS50268_19370 [Spirochaetia bacterium]|nr:hypothetical protein AGMMS50268_19370 [Spirochaetia bacterium]